jgi:tRNA(fMet)-specific endonuclease VapC
MADTDVLIDYLTGVQPISDQVESHLNADALQTTAISCFELLSGVREGRRGDKARRFIASIPVLVLDREGAAAAASIRQELSRKGLSIGMADSLIAGIALARNLPLMTRNRKHFENVVGLMLISF